MASSAVVPMIIGIAILFSCVVFSIGIFQLPNSFIDECIQRINSDPTKQLWKFVYHPDIANLQSYFYPTLQIWDPIRYGRDKKPLPPCGKCGKKSLYFYCWSHQHGWSGRTIYGIFESGILITSVYRCQERSCRRVTFGYDDAFMRNLRCPPSFLLGQCGAVSFNLANHICALFHENCSLHAIERIVHDEFDVEWRSRYRQYILAMNWSDSNEPYPVCPPLPTTPSRNFLTQIILASEKTMVNEYMEHLNEHKITTWISADHTFKVPKIVKKKWKSAFATVYENLFVVLNQHGQVCIHHYLQGAQSGMKIF